MKNKILIFSIFLISIFCSQTIFGQVNSTNSLEINSLYLKKTSTNSMHNLSIFKSGFTSVFGNPDGSSIEVSEMDGLTYNKLNYSLNNFWFVDNKLISLELNNQEFAIFYNNTEIKLGDDCSNLSLLFPISFINKSNNRIFISITYNGLLTDSSLSFEYNNLNVITDISLQ